MKKLLLIIAMVFSGLIFSQNLPIIAVTEIQSSVDSKYWRDYKNSKSNNFQNMLETQLVKVGRFKIMERNRIDEVLSEQALQGEFSGSGTNMAMGAVDYIVYGSVTKFGKKEKVIQTNKFSSVKIITEFGIDLKVVSALDGEVRRAEAVNVVLETASGMSTGKVSTGDAAADPLSDVQRRAAKKVAAAIAESIFPIGVITFRDNEAYLNYGEAILTVGDRLKVIQPGEELIDEATGLNLGATETVVGTVEVTEALEKFSKAKVIRGGNPGKGMQARIIKDASSGAGGNRSGPQNQRQPLGRQI
tara:strand:+ start:170 stop:1078 length:909 start_codon:yes stop_codon:yes gene_type:complete